MGRYGPAPKNTDSAVNILLDVVGDQSGKQYRMDHYATRYPTNVVDIADFLVRLACASSPSSHLLLFHLRAPAAADLQNTSLALPSTRVIPPILHYSAGEPFTKYEMCLVFARILGLPHAHIIADAEPPNVRPPLLSTIHPTPHARCGENLNES